MGPRSSLLLSPEFRRVAAADPMPAHLVQTRPRGWPPSAEAATVHPTEKPRRCSAPGPDLPTRGAETQRDLDPETHITAAVFGGPRVASALHPLHRTYLYGELSPEAPYNRDTGKWPKTMSPKWDFGQNTRQVPVLPPAGSFRAASRPLCKTRATGKASWQGGEAQRGLRNCDDWWLLLSLLLGVRPWARHEATRS